MNFEKNKKAFNENYEEQVFDISQSPMITDLQHAPMTSVDSNNFFSTYENI